MPSESRDPQDSVQMRIVTCAEVHLIATYSAALKVRRFVNTPGHPRAFVWLMIILASERIIRECGE